MLIFRKGGSVFMLWKMIGVLLFKGVITAP